MAIGMRAALERFLFQTPDQKKNTTNKSNPYRPSNQLKRRGYKCVKKSFRASEGVGCQLPADPAVFA